MSELSDEARALIASTRRGDDPVPADEARVLRSVMLRIGAGAIAGAAAATVGQQAAAAGAAKAGMGWGALAGSSTLKLLAVMVVGGTVTAGGYWAMKAPAKALSPTAVASPSATAPARAACTIATAAATEPTPSLAVDDLPVASAQEAEPAPPPAPAAHKGSNLMAEVAAVGSANRALRDGDPERALRVLNDNANVLSEGTLREETAVSRILALCQLGRTQEASAEARSFLQTWPNSPLAARVRASCAFSPTSSSARE